MTNTTTTPTKSTLSSTDLCNLAHCIKMFDCYLLEAYLAEEHDLGDGTTKIQLVIIPSESLQTDSLMSLLVIALQSQYSSEWNIDIETNHSDENVDSCPKVLVFTSTT